MAAIFTKNVEQYISRDEAGALLVNGEATAIAIHDRNGNLIWEQRKVRLDKPLKWHGTDNQGKVIELGNYVCKISYRDGAVVDLPFVFLA